MARNKLLIMDDDLDVSAFFRDVGESLGFEVRRLNESAHFIDTVAAFAPDLILLDLQLPDQDGIELLRRLGEVGCDANILIASGLETRVLQTAEKLGKSLGLSIAGSFCKPIELPTLKALLEVHCPQEREFTADELRYAIDTGQLVVHYLPKITRKPSGAWIADGVEALVRWQHETHGLIYPGEFVPLAEESGLVVALTDYVFRAAMDQARVWFSQGIYFELGLNLSTDFLTELEFPDRLVALVREKGLDPSMITLEVTETPGLVDADLAMTILARLRMKQINLCLDDFGVGHSSLTHLYKMPFNEVKLDNAFVSDMQHSDEARRMVEGLVHLVHKLDMLACAEGVEDEATFRMLEELGCDRIQGHHVGPALPARELRLVAENWNSRYPAAERSETG